MEEFNLVLDFVFYEFGIDVYGYSKVYDYSNQENEGLVKQNTFKSQHIRNLRSLGINFQKNNSKGKGRTSKNESIK